MKNKIMGSLMFVGAILLVIGWETNLWLLGTGAVLMVGVYLFDIFTGKSRIKK